MPHARTNGISAFYEDNGVGPALVLIHGYSADLRMWKYQVPTLVDAGLRVVTYDIRGHGRSTIALGGYSVQNYAADLGGLLDRLNVDAAHVAGLSLGGGIALQFALDFPKRVRSLTLVDSTLPGFTYSGETNQRIQDLVEAVRRDGPRAAFDKIWLKHPFFDGLRRHPERFAELREMILAFQAPDMREGATPGDYRADVSDRLAEIAAPTLVVVGEKDDPDFHLIGDLLVANLPNARQVAFPDCWHMTPMEHPDEFNDTLIEFLRSIDPA